MQDISYKWVMLFYINQTSLQIILSIVQQYLTLQYLALTKNCSKKCILYWLGHNSLGWQKNNRPGMDFIPQNLTRSD